MLKARTCASLLPSFTPHLFFTGESHDSGVYPHLSNLRTRPAFHNISEETSCAVIGTDAPDSLPSSVSSFVDKWDLLGNSAQERSQHFSNDYGNTHHSGHETGSWCEAASSSRPALSSYLINRFPLLSLVLFHICPPQNVLSLAFGGRRKQRGVYKPALLSFKGRKRSL